MATLEFTQAPNAPTIAVLAVQGAFAEHEAKLDQLGVRHFELRQAADLSHPFDALILPGGESTVQAALLHELGMFEPLQQKIRAGLPVLGTCAGLILLAGQIDPESGDLAGRNAQAAKVRTKVDGFGTLPVTVRRNAYGRQLSSFHAQGIFAGQSIPMTFIRAPYITQVGQGVEVLSEENGHVTAVRFGNQVGLSFHPELDDDLYAYRYFLHIVQAR